VTSTDGVRVTLQPPIGRLTLDRPQAINALTLGMIRGLRAALDAWADDPAVEVVVIDGAGERGLCAGGDIKALRAAVL
jgi:enoyl-CoA hydratase